MSLVNEKVQVAGSAAAPDKSISVYNGGGNFILYTVPDGRKFEGFLNTNYSSFSSIFQINDQGIHGSGQYSQNIQVTLLAGDVVRTWSYGGGVYGIESDA